MVMAESFLDQTFARTDNRVFMPDSEPCTAGDEVVMGISSSGTFTTGKIHAGKNTVTADTCFDQIGVDITDDGTSTEYVMGVYDSDGVDGTAKTLLSQTIALAPSIAFDYKAIPEFTAPNTVIWLAIQFNGTFPVAFLSGSGLRRDQSITYSSTFPDPMVPVNANNPIRMKITHS